MTIDFFTEESSAQTVIQRIGPEVDPRLREIMTVLTRHLHAAVKEIEPTTSEWMAAVDFLTATGKICSDWRQEFILLSDVLGISMLVDAINHRTPGGETESTVLGPFYIPDAPVRQHGDDICLDAKGEPIIVSGKVTGPDGTPLEGVFLDVWQANEDGFYDVQQRGIQPDFNLRGVFHTDQNGEYWFKSVKPRFYPIPDDGPVGKLLSALRRHPYRPAHLHFIVGRKGRAPLVTHMFTGGPYIDSDAVFGVKESLIADYTIIDDPAEAARFKISGPFTQLRCDFVLP